MITIFRNIRETSIPYYSTVEEIIERIRTGKNKDLVLSIRAEEEKKKRDELKQKLPSILFTGDFPNRKKNALPKQHSGLIILDIDDLGDYTMESMGKVLKSDPHTYVAFVSPSGNGYKVLVRIPPDIARHVGYFLALEKHYLEKYKIELDQSGKNIGRVCYESYDPDVFISDEAKRFNQFIEPIKSKPKSKSTLDVLAIKSEDTIIDRLVTWWLKNFDFNSGRNTAIFQLASAFNRFGVSYHAAQSHCAKYEDYSKPADPFTSKEIEKVVDNVYSSQSSKHGTEIMEDSQKRQNIADDIMGKELDKAAEILSDIEEFKDFAPIELEQVAEKIQSEAKTKRASGAGRQFWFYDDGKLKLNLEDLIIFINELGYYIYYPVKTPNSYILIKIQNNIIKPVDEREIKEEVLAYVKDQKQNAVYNILADRVKYWTKGFLNTLPAINPPILRDNAHTSFIPTPSGVYKVTQDSIIKIDYVDLTEGYVWESQITAKDFEYQGANDINKSDFADFVTNVGGDKAQSLYTIIGYLLHNYKDPSSSKAVFLYDKNLSQVNGESEGGSGKSLIIEGVKKIREVAPIPGDRVDFKRSFVFQELNESTQVAWVDELPQNADMSKFFSRITNGIPIEKKNQNPIFIENEMAPKFVFTTNFKPKGSSGSHKRRRIDFSVTPFFSSSYTPREKYGKSFFTEWDKMQWDLFFSFCLECLKEYLGTGIATIQDDDDTYLTVLSECGPDFVEFWLDSGYLSAVKKQGYFLARPFYHKMIQEQEIDSKELSMRKYLQGIRKILKLHSINFTETGKREQIQFTIS